MIIDDTAAMLRLAGNPEMALRHDEFVAGYSRGAVPGQVVQLRPADQVLALNLDDSELLARLAAGAPTRHGYWDSFRSGARPRPNLHGVSSLPEWANPGWAFEAHRDGHFIAGVWHFPKVDDPTVKSSAALPAFFGAIFEDFFAVVASVVAPICSSVAFNASATISGTDALNFMTKSEFGDQWVKARGPLQRQLVQLPIYPTHLGGATWEATARDLARAMCGVYGFAYRV